MLQSKRGGRLYRTTSLLTVQCMEDRGYTKNLFAQLHFCNLTTDLRNELLHHSHLPKQVFLPPSTKYFNQMCVSKSPLACINMLCVC